MPILIVAKVDVGGFVFLPAQLAMGAVRGLRDRQRTVAIVVGGRHHGF